MIDEPLPATERTDAEPNSTDETPDRDAADETPDRDATAPPREPSSAPRGQTSAPRRATDPPPDSVEGDAGRERDREPSGEEDEADESERYEYRLERVRLWRTVAALAVAVARLIRSL